jgi:hypothetical protein
MTFKINRVNCLVRVSSICIQVKLCWVLYRGFLFFNIRGLSRYLEANESHEPFQPNSYSLATQDQLTN